MTLCTSLPWVGLCLCLVMPACADDGPDGDDPPALPERAAACNPLGETACLMPWPSAAYLRDDPDSVTGVRVDLPAAAMPVTDDGVAIDPAPYNRFDGFAPSGPMLALFPDGVSADGLPPADEPAASLAADSATIVLNMDTGERLAHFAEPDMNMAQPERQALIIRPLERMAPGARYAVAIRRTVRAADGSEMPVPAAFQAVVAGDRGPFEHPRLNVVAGRYDAIFAALEADGVDRGELLLAWDFVVASEQWLTGDLLSMRAQALPILSEPQSFAAEEVPADPELVLRALAGTYEVPSFLSSGGDPDSVMVRDETGAPMRSGTYDANFSALLPSCVSDPDTVLPIPVVVFGHGLFGSAAEFAGGDLLPTIADELCV
ncbi:MAG: hypothetical protein AAGC55_10805, partial [Myxococcota bacterium]